MKYILFIIFIIFLSHTSIFFAATDIDGVEGVLFQMLDINNQFYLSIYKPQKKNFLFLYRYEKGGFNQVNRKKYPHKFMNIYTKNKEFDLDLKKIPIRLIEYSEISKCRLTLIAKENYSKNKLSCNFWGKTQSIKISLNNNAISKYTPVEILYNSINKEDKYYIGLGINDHFSPKGFAYVIFSKDKIPKFINRPPNCSQGFASELYMYNDLKLCLNEVYYWKVIENNKVRDLPNPCSNISDIFFWKKHLWGGYYNMEKILTLCQFSQKLSKSLQVFKFKIEKDDLQPILDK